MLSAEADAGPVSGPAARLPLSPVTVEAAMPELYSTPLPLDPADCRTVRRARCRPLAALPTSPPAAQFAAPPASQRADRRRRRTRHGYPESCQPRRELVLGWRPGFSSEGRSPWPDAPMPARSETPPVIRSGLAGGLTGDQRGELLDVVPGPQARDGSLVGWPGLGEQFG